MRLIRYDLLGWCTRWARMRHDYVDKEPASDGDWVEWSDVEDVLQEIVDSATRRVPRLKPVHYEVPEEVMLEIKRLLEVPPPAARPLRAGEPR